MAELGSMVEKVRSKNAGPFWLTIDIFCGNAKSFEDVSSKLETSKLAMLLNCSEATIKRFDIRELHVIKFSLPRPEVQGSIRDRDLHGASWGALIAEMDI